MNQILCVIIVILLTLLLLSLFILGQVQEERRELRRDYEGIQAKLSELMNKEAALEKHITNPKNENR